MDENLNLNSHNNSHPYPYPYPYPYPHPYPYPYPHPHPYPHPWCYPYPRFSNAAPEGGCILIKSETLQARHEVRRCYYLQRFSRALDTYYITRFIGGFHVTSSPPCWWTVNKRSLISSFCLSTSICSFHHCYLCLPRLHENLL